MYRFTAILTTAILTTAILMTGLSESSGAAIAIGYSDGAHYVQMYDIDTDSATSVWSGADSMGGLAYDPEQDDVYFCTENGDREYMWRDNEPAVSGNGSLEYEKEYYGGGQDRFDFLSLDVAPQSQVAYSWRDPESASLYFIRWTGIQVRDVTTDVETEVYKVPRYRLKPGTSNVIEHWHELGGLAVDSAGEWVYFSDSIQGTMNRVRLDGTGLETLLSGLGTPGQVAVYGSNVYWVESESGTIRRSDLLGGGATTLITPTQSPYDIEVGSGRIYWTNTTWSAVNYSDLNGNNIDTLGGNSPSGTLIALANVPEPTSLALLSALGGLGFFFFAVRRRRRPA